MNKTMIRVLIILISVCMSLTLFALLFVRTIILDTEVESIPYSNRYVVNGFSTNLPEPTRVGYVFNGWFDLVGNEYTDQTKITKNVELVAYWVPTFYEVSYETNGGSSILPQFYTVEQDVIAPGVTYKEGFTFAGWYSDQGLTKSFQFNTPMQAENMTLYAKWIPSN